MGLAPTLMAPTMVSLPKITVPAVAARLFRFGNIKSPIAEFSPIDFVMVLGPTWTLPALEVTVFSRLMLSVKMVILLFAATVLPVVRFPALLTVKVLREVPPTAPGKLMEPLPADMVRLWAPAKVPVIVVENPILPPAVEILIPEPVTVTAPV